MSDYSNMSLNQHGMDLVKREQTRFTDFIETLGKEKVRESADKPVAFTPAYCHACAKHEPQQNTKMSIVRSKDQAFQGVTELYFSGGGGAGCAYPSAIKYACHLGLDLSKIEVSCGVSVGAIMALGVALNVKAEDLQALLADMPTASFQDWSVWNIVTKFPSTWGLCRGQAMPNYFQKLIKDQTGLDNPTFKEFYDAGFKKELRVVTTNVSMGKPVVFSYKNTPDLKVAETVALSSSIPFVFPVKRIMNEEGMFDIHTDGGLLKNFPWAMGAKEFVPNEQRLGLALVNSATSPALHSKAKGKSISTLLEYGYHLFTLMVFQQPLSITEEERQRTVLIRVNHNPIDFTPSPKQQKYLEDQSYAAVEELANQLCKNVQSPPPSPKKVQSKK